MTQVGTVCHLPVISLSKEVNGDKPKTMKKMSLFGDSEEFGPRELYSYRRACGGFRRAVFVSRECKEGEFSWSLLKWRTNGDQP